MKWNSIKNLTSNDVDNDQFLVTDGKYIWVAMMEYGAINIFSDRVEDTDSIKSRLTHWIEFFDIPLPNQPERSKRENSHCEMRCSEHCVNTVSEAK